MFPKKNQTVLKVEALESRWMPAGLNPGQLLESVHGRPDGIVFVDKSLVDEVPVAEFGDDLVVAVDGQSDPVEQMGAVIRAGDGIRSVRIISHGSDGTIWLGGRAINSDYLLSRSEEVSEWAAHLSDDADLLLYGCDVAANESGKEYTGLWSSLTGADVAASNDATGAGGDLTLEYVTGPVSGALQDTLAQWEVGGLSLGVLPNERTAAGAVWTAGSGKQFPNFFAYAVLNKDGTITAWGDPGNGGTGVPEGNNYVEIVSNYKAFTAIRSDGTVVSWGNKDHGGASAPVGVRFKEISATGSAFAGLKEDGSIVVWGNPKEGGAGAPTGNDFIKIYSGAYTFTAMRKDGSLITWAEEKPWGIPWKAPEGTGFKEVFSTTHGLSAVKEDGTAYGWGDWSYGWANETTPFKNVKTVASTHGAFTALHFDGTVTSWASAWWGNQNVPIESGFVNIYSTGSSFAGLKEDGSIRSWGHPDYGGKDAPLGNNFVSVSSTANAFAALTKEGSIVSWGAIPKAPSGNGFKAIYSNNYAFAAIAQDGSIKAWGLEAYGGVGAPTDSGYVHIFSNLGSFAAVKSDGTIVTWGDPSAGGKGAPTGNGGLAIQSTQMALPYFAPGTKENWNANIGSVFSQKTGVRGLGILYRISLGALPSGLTLDPVNGTVSGNPLVGGRYTFTIQATNDAGSVSRNYSIRVQGSGLLPNQRIGSGETIFSGSSQQFPNAFAFAALRSDGTITSWGASHVGGANAPTGNGFVEVVSNQYAFAAIKEDGSIRTWGDPNAGGAFTPPGNGYVQISSSGGAFAALKSDGSIFAWGHGYRGADHAPIGTGFTKIFSARDAFAALKTDGSIVYWGWNLPDNITLDGKGYVDMVSGRWGFAALKDDGSILSWSGTTIGGNGAPTEKGFIAVYSSGQAFAALRSDGSIYSWGDAGWGGTGAPKGNGFVSIFATQSAFVALHRDGSLAAWGSGASGGSGAPSGNNYVNVYSTDNAFTALTSDGKLVSWGWGPDGAGAAPKDAGYVKVFSNEGAFSAIRSDGSIATWGSNAKGGTGGPAGKDFVHIYATEKAFAALRKDGTIVSWGDQGVGGTGAPSGNQFVAIQSVMVSPPYFAPGSKQNLQVNPGKAFNQKLDARGLDLTYEVISGNLPEGLSLDSRTGMLSGIPTGKGLGSFTVRVSNEAGAVTRVYGIGSEDSNLVFNGDFELGNVGFTTDYLFSKGDIGGAQWYDILNNPAQGRPRDINPPSYTDHTSGKGLMMAANGAVSPNKVVWTQTVGVIPGKSYDFSMWISSWYAGNPAKLDVQFNGVSVGVPVAPSSVGPWAQFKTVWNSGSSSQVVIRIIETGRADIGSDFALDDISLTLSKSSAPAFTSVDNATFVAGKQGSFQVTAAGSPSPTISLAEGKLPAGMTLNSSGLLSGTPKAGTSGTYTLKLKASNGIGVDAVQSFTLVVQQAPVFLSGPSATFRAGIDGKFQVLVQAFPAATVTLVSGALPGGLSFDSTNGLISGKPAGGTGGLYKISLKASNSLGDTNQDLTLMVTESPTISSVDKATFELGKANAFQVTTTGYPAAQITLASGKLPRGVTLGTDGKLSGTPSAGTNGTYKFVLKAANGSGINATQEFTLLVGQAPAITSASQATFTAGKNGVFQVKTTGSPEPTLTLAEGALPKGLTIDSKGKLSGVPEEGTGGVYTVVLQAVNGIGAPARQTLTVTVNQASRIISGATANFQVGQNGKFQVETTGFPKPVVSLVSGKLPAGLSMDSTGLVSGTPNNGTEGTYTLKIRATNLVGVVATQNLVLMVSGVATSKNLLQNGDFEQGNTGFTSQYRYSKGAVNYAQTYDIVTDPVKASMGNSGWASYGDHTTGKGMMMVLSGSPTNGQVAWSQTVDVTPNGNYRFSLWVSSWLATNPGTLDIRLNGVSMRNLQSPGSTGKWEQVTVDWSAGSAKTLKIEILNKASGYLGGHIALDDLRLERI